jgi:tol-pal system protein YbgF
MRVQSASRSLVALAFAVLIGAVQTGCVSVAEHRKLERDVLQMKRATGSGSGERVADLRAQIDGLERRLAKVEGRADEAQHDATRALEEAKLARRESSGAPAGPLPVDAQAASTVPDAAPAEPTQTSPASTPASTATTATSSSVATTPSAAVAPAGERAEAGASVQEVSAYRDAHATYRGGEYDACIDRFRSFLQTYPASPYADDAAYWMAECHFKKGDYKSAVLRFDDVVARYPEGDKSADALYRQGEALLKLGPGYAKAASKAFERVVAEYPNSTRAAEAKKQLEVLGSRG